mmetsp:Transcript_59273/g.70725  ORF Transcript_59273/g.70725 Transcript_59273/m.70725 type:complete len:362 (+) Transcript_59273:681-1766(+)
MISHSPPKKLNENATNVSSFPINDDDDDAYNHMNILNSTPPHGTSAKADATTTTNSLPSAVQRNPVTHNKDANSSVLLNPPLPPANRLVDAANIGSSPPAFDTACMDGPNDALPYQTPDDASFHSASVKAGLTDSLVLLFPPANGATDTDNVGSSPPNDNTVLRDMPNVTFSCSPPKEFHINTMTVFSSPHNSAGSHIVEFNTVPAHSAPAKVNVTTATNIKYLPSNYNHTATLTKMSTLQQTIASFTYDLSVANANNNYNLLIITTMAEENSTLLKDIHNLQTTNKKIHQLSQSLLKQTQDSDKKIRKALFDRHLDIIPLFAYRSHKLQPDDAHEYTDTTKEFSITDIETEMERHFYPDI